MAMVDFIDNRNWIKVPIKEIYEGLFDGPHATPKPASNGPIFLGIKNITDDGRLDLSETRHISEEDFSKWTKRINPRPGDIVFTYEATLNRYAIIPKGFEGCLGRRLALIRPDPQKIDTRYLFYYFFSEEWRKTISQKIIFGSTVDRIPLISFPEFEISLPPLPTQRKIAAILSAYDDLIENNTRRIKILEEMAQALYREWFVHFRFPGHEKVPMVDSPLGKIPEGWELKRLGDIAQEVRRTIKPSQIDPETPYFGLEHLPRRSIALSEWDTAKNILSAKLLIKRGEILFGKIRPYFHKVGVAPLDGICSSDIIVISPQSSEYFSIVLSCVSSKDFVDLAAQTSKGTKMPRADWSILANYRIALPVSKLLIILNNFINDTVLQIINIIFQIRNLRTTRDLLLSRLFSEYNDLEIFLKEGCSYE
jgi:type I restriction enzyme S subunit